MAAVTNSPMNDHLTAQMPRSEDAIEGSMREWLWPCSTMLKAYAQLRPELALNRPARDPTRPIGSATSLQPVNQRLLDSLVTRSRIQTRLSRHGGAGRQGFE